ncbi:MAG: arsenate reductase ArsC [Candidatus Margulisiibacteriota bacterium]
MAGHRERKEFAKNREKSYTKRSMNSNNHQKVLFVCMGNAIRSQIAEAFAKQLGGHKVEAYSAGVIPPKVIDPKTVEVMKELEIDLSQAKPKGFFDLIQQEFEYVVALAPNLLCPFYPKKEKLYWRIKDPRGKPIKDFRQARDEIRSLVKEFIEKIQ